METKKWITVVGAREHNLKNITVQIPKESLTVITGPSGSGKSTLALDVLYAEGQRRYIESLSSYARQFLGIPPKPHVERIEGLCPAIAIDQKTVGANPRSTVGTITEIYDYLRVLFARVGMLHCPSCHKPVHAESPETIAQKLQALYTGHTITIGAPVANEKKGEFTNQLEKFFLNGFYRFLIDGKIYSFRSLNALKELSLKKTHKHTIDIIIDTLEVSPSEAARMHEGVEVAFNLTQGLCKIIAGNDQHTYSSKRMCIDCTRSLPEIEPRLFSFNSPLGACKKCHGLGIILLAPSMPWYAKLEEHREQFETLCTECKGQRLNPLALAVTVGGFNIHEISAFSIKKALEFFKNLTLDATQQAIAERLLNEIINRYTFLSDVGLGYLTLTRTARTLSGGESQRIRLATQIGSALSGVLYVLDEPSIGLHQRDNDRLIGTLKKLRDQGNTVLVVEHDFDTMTNADYIIDMGPAAGVHGGTIVATGNPDDLCKKEHSLTGAYLAGRKNIIRKQPTRKPERFLTIHGASTHNLKNITTAFPLQVFCCVSGVSGSGKSTLVMEELVPTLESALKHKLQSSSSGRIQGFESIETQVVIDQTPIGRTPRSNPATYLGIFDDIRKLFSGLPESNARGYSPGRFSFNVAEGRCAHCQGEGVLTISMHFLPDVTVTCNHCKGLRYNPQTLEIFYKGKHIAHILDMTAEEAAIFFEHHPSLSKRLNLMCSVGLDYIKLGQPSTTLSGGEAQRIKLVNELAKRGSNTLYILDEPTTGLHAQDIEKLLIVLNRLVDKGNSVLVIEHNIDVLKVADYLIELGPEGGDEGGHIIAQGTPEDVAKSPKSVTAPYLQKALSVTK